MAAFHFTVVPRRAGPDQFVPDAVMVTESIQGMGPFGSCHMRELCAIVRLKHLRSVSEIRDSPLHKVNGGIAALLRISINEALPRGVLYHCVLVKPLTVCATVTGFGDIFDIHLPFDAQLLRGIVMAPVQGFLLR